MLSKLSNIVAQYAPLVGAVLPIPGGQAIGELIANIFGGNINNPDDLIERIKNDKDAGFKLAQLQLNHQAMIEKIFLEDKQNARQREVEYIKSTGKEDKTLKILAYITTIGFFVALFLLFYPQTQINDHERDLLAMLIGMLTSKWQTVIDYFFGASNG